MEDNDDNSDFLNGWDHMEWASWTKTTFHTRNKILCVIQMDLWSQICSKLVIYHINPIAKQVLEDTASGK